MPYDPSRHHRRSIRLKGYDYTQPGAYFITICTHNRIHWFGHIVDGVMRLNAYGEIVREEWFQAAVVRPYVVLYPDEFVVMPNHVHGIIWIIDRGAETPDTRETLARTPQLVQAARRVAQSEASHRVASTSHGPDAGSIGAILGQFKSATTRRINALRNTAEPPVWHRNYYEHIIRHERALNAIRRYIQENPLRWYLDRENPTHTGGDPLAQEIWAMFQEDDAEPFASEEL